MSFFLSMNQTLVTMVLRIVLQQQINTSYQLMKINNHSRLIIMRQTSPAKGRTIRKLMGGGGRAKYKKKNSRKGKLNEKKFMHAN